MSEVSVRPVTEGVFTVDPPRLLGARCGACGECHFPRLEQCPYCGAGDATNVELSDHGTLWGWTTVTAPPPGSIGPVPYGFGVVELPEGIRVVSRIVAPDPSALDLGIEMTVVLDDHSRAVPGYTVTVGAPSAINTSLALRQAIWTKADPAWPMSGPARTAPCSRP